MDIDDENFGEHFEEQDLENLLADAAGSHITTESTAFLPQSSDRRAGGGPSRDSPARQPWKHQGRKGGPSLDDDDDVPESLLLEGNRDVPESSKRTTTTDAPPPPVPGPSTRRARAQWEAARTQQRLHDEDHNTRPTPVWQASRGTGQFVMDPRERALWLWANVQDLDAFLHEVYDYFIGAGVWSIVMRRTITLM